MRDFVRGPSYHEIEAMHGIGHETLRKFVTYDPDTGEGTRKPHARTLDRYAELYHEAHPEGYVMERKSDGTPGALRPLKMTLPSGEKRATEAVHELFRRAREHPEGLPEGVDSLEGWLKHVLRAQYAVEAKYGKKGGKNEE